MAPRKETIGGSASHKVGGSASHKIGQIQEDMLKIKIQLNRMEKLLKQIDQKT
jgi:hypothetical protein